MSHVPTISTIGGSRFICWKGIGTGFVEYLPTYLPRGCHAVRHSVAQQLLVLWYGGGQGRLPFHWWKGVIPTVWDGCAQNNVVRVHAPKVYFPSCLCGLAAADRLGCSTVARNCGGSWRNKQEILGGLHRKRKFDLVMQMWWCRAGRPSSYIKYLKDPDLLLQLSFFYIHIFQVQTVLSF